VVSHHNQGGSHERDDRHRPPQGVAHRGGHRWGRRSALERQSESDPSPSRPVDGFIANGTFTWTSGGFTPRATSSAAVIDDSRLESVTVILRESPFELTMFSWPGLAWAVAGSVAASVDELAAACLAAMHPETVVAAMLAALRGRCGPSPTRCSCRANHLHHCQQRPDR
jgi:hypothetical protein